MLREFADYLLKLGNIRQEQIGGQIFTTQPMHLVGQPRPNPLTVHNLSGIVDYLTRNYDVLGPVLIQIESPTEVNVYSSFNRDMKRNHYLRAEALLPDIPFERFLDIETFIVLLQSSFVENEDRAKMLSIVGNIKEENVTTVGDDGISQQVTAKAGIATVENVKVPNPVLLKPYRTFVDITQPESRFVFRMRSGPAAALFEADGGAWRIEALESIKNYLAKALKEKIDNGDVTIIA